MARLTEQLTSAAEARPEGAFRDHLRRMPWASAVLIAAFLAAAVFPQLLAPHDPLLSNLAKRNTPPVWLSGNPEHLLGADQLGRDLLSRVIYGAQVSLGAAAGAIILGGGVGLALGILAGYFGRKTDTIIMRAVDAMMAFPTILLALLFAVVLGPSFWNIIIVLGLVLWARFERIIRAEVLSVKERDFVALARVAGASPPRIMLVHIFPNVVNTFIVMATLDVGWVILVEASLSFLGAGIPPPTPAWGGMVAAGRQYLESAWWVSFVPGVAIMLVVLSFNLLGDWLRDALDPKLRQV